MRNDFETNYLQHWGLKKGEERKNHKYYIRVGESGKYRYFYTLEEYQAWMKQKGGEVSKKVNEVKNKLQLTVSKGFKMLDKKLNPKKYDQIKKDLSTPKAQEEKKNTHREIINQTKQKQKNKDFSTITAKEKASVKKEARKTAEEIAKKKRYEENVRKAKEKKQKENEQLKLITQKQQERKNKAQEKAMNEAVEKRKEQKKNWLDEFRKKAINLFCKDAKDSAKEDHTKHPEVPIKTSVLSKDQDMQAVNRGKRFYEEMYDRYFQYGKRIDEEKGKQKEYAKKADENSINCANCTIAYDLRRRGYDVTAPRQVTNDGLTLDEMLYCYKTPDGKDPNEVSFVSDKGTRVIRDTNKTYNVKTYNSSQYGQHSDKEQAEKDMRRSSYYSFEEKEIQKIKKEILNSYPEGSYGILATYWQGGGGHAQVWSIEDGEVVIRDAQVNEKDTLENRLDRSLSCDIVRTDNLELADQAYEYAMAEEMDGAKVVKKKRG